MDDATIAGWSSYLPVLAGAAATLPGLVFVAASINLTRVLTTTGLTGRAAEWWMRLLGVVAISTTALIPQQGPITLGVKILVIGSLLWLAQTALQIRYLTSKTGYPRRWGISSGEVSGGYALRQA